MSAMQPCRCVPGSWCTAPDVCQHRPGARRVYVSGPMSGLPESNFPAFNRAAKDLRALGYVVVNPAEINPGDPPPPDAGEAVLKDFWRRCLRADIRELCDCHMIALLPGWEDSSGAHLEVHVAHRLGIKVTTVAALMNAVFEPIGETA